MEEKPKVKKNGIKRTRAPKGIELAPDLLGRMVARCAGTIADSLPETPSEKEKKAANLLTMALVSKQVNAAVEQWLEANGK